MLGGGGVGDVGDDSRQQQRGATCQTILGGFSLRYRELKYTNGVGTINMHLPHINPVFITSLMKGRVRLVITVSITFCCSPAVAPWDSSTGSRNFRERGQET